MEPAEMISTPVLQQRTDHHHLDPAPVPVASLLPGLTEVLIDLGFAPSIVATSHECTLPTPHITTAKLPVTPSIPSREIAAGWNAVTHANPWQASSDILTTRTCSFYHVDHHALARTRPRVLLTHLAPPRTPADPDEAALRTALLRAVPTLEAVISANCRTLRDVFQLHHDVARVMRRPAAAVGPVASARTALHSISARAREAGAPLAKVAVVQWADPLFLAGDWVPAVATLAGAAPDGVTREGGPSVEVSPEVLVRVNVVVFAVCAVDLVGCSKIVNRFWMEHGDRFRRWEGSFVVTNAMRLFSRPSLSTVVQSAEVMADIVLNSNRFGHKNVIWDFWEAPQDGIYLRSLSEAKQSEE